MAKLMGYRQADMAKPIGSGQRDSLKATGNRQAAVAKLKGTNCKYYFKIFIIEPTSAQIILNTISI